MKNQVVTSADYINQLPEERQKPFEQLVNTINQHLPDGFEETIIYNMVGWVVPHDTYPDGYHCDPKLPLPFINIASQKNFIALYHNGLYAKQSLCDWFVEEYPNHASRKLDMGKSCVRFKKMDDIPYQLIGELVSKMTVDEWIEIYESSEKRG